MRTQLIRLIAVVWAVSLVLPVAASANMASPVQPGDVLGEPAGDLAGIAIEHEDLRIDLRPLAQGRPAVIDATYRIRNDGPGREVELVFVATSLTAGVASVKLDGQPLDFQANYVPAGRNPDTEIGAPWPPPSTTPGVRGGRDLRYSATIRGQLLFTPTIEPGQHEIAVHYAAGATAYSGDSPVRYWQLGYVLSPARRWASFGTLDVAVQLPTGWVAATAPALDRVDDELRGAFDGIPADALAITAQAPLPPEGLPGWLVIVALLGVGGLLGWLGGGLLGRRGRGARWLLPISLAYGIGAVVIAGATGAFAQSQSGIPDSQRAWTYGYGAIFVVILVLPLLLIGGAVVMQVAAVVAASRARSGRTRPS